jgi:hypothetical protein
MIRSEVTLGDIISAASFLAAAVGLFLNWWELRIAAVQKRAEFIVSVFNQYVLDPDCADVFYAIEYNSFEYGEEFHGSKEERQLDRLLSYFAKIAALYELGIIKWKDLDLVTYEFVRVYQNSAVQEYFKTLDSLAEVVGVKGGNFDQYRRVAARLAAEQKWVGPAPPWPRRPPSK